MANTLGGVSLASVAQQSLDVLLPRLQQFSNFTTDFSGENETGTTTISTRVATATTAGTIGTGYAAARQDVTTTVKTITLSDVYGNVIGFLDNEWNASKINLMDVFIQPNINAICDGIMTAALNLVTAAAVGNVEDTSKKTIATAAELDYQAAADLATIVTNRNVPSAPRFLMLKPTYYAGLAKDSSISQAFSIGGTDVIQRNVLPNVAGFSVSQYVNFPDNSENLVGVCGGKQGIIIAGRVPKVGGDFPGEVMNVTDPESGFTLQLRKWYSADLGRYLMSMGVQYGVAIGNAANLVRIVSA